jgi:hypothetical protein
MPWVSNGSGIIDQASTFHLIGVVHNFCYIANSQETKASRDRTMLPVLDSRFGFPF